MTARRLGRLPVRHDPRTLRLASYLRPTLPESPPAVDYADLVRKWPMYRNDELGCCTMAMVGHQVQAWTAEGRGRRVDLPEAAIVRAYSAVSGYDPGDPSTDRGAVMLDVMRYWRSAGVGGHLIGAFASVRPSDAETVRVALWLFGGLSVGVSLPRTAEGQRVWDVVADAPEADRAAGSWGGHAISLLSYDRDGLTCITWGAPLRMTWRFLATYGDEAFAALSRDFLAGGRAPNGFDVAALSAGLAAVSR